ncbi:MAG TPA: efflux RND transporter permease subunit [Burkholderiales bacterium]|nr:efflux RND transporter permease subunit [Burkholderiales bacterium]
MWIVDYALRRKYTIGVLAILVFLLGSYSIRRMSTDILPVVDIPAVNIIWTYSGLNATEMASKVTSFSELAVMNNVDNIRAIESQTVNGVGLVRVEFQPNADIETALAQTTAISQTILRRMPQGMQPPIIVRYSVSSVPILQLALSSPTLTESQLSDYARLGLRAQIQTIPGIRMTLPYGGQARQIMVDLNLERLQAYGLSPADVSRAVTAQNLTLPSGTVREGRREAQVRLNLSPESAAAFNDLPLRSVDGRVIFLRDVANVRDGGAVQNNIARMDGDAGVIVSLLKLGDASTVDIVDQVIGRLPMIRVAAPEGVRIEPIFDQSLFVRAAIDAVMHEGALVALLVAAVVLIFLGSARSTFIVLTSIPLSLLASLCGLYAFGYTLNLMTLGGMALAIGILVDNAMVEIENINRNVALGKPLRQAILDSAQQVVFPEFVSTLSICIVFVPVFLLTGAPKFVFTPLALAVVFAMMASFLFSRTLVPAMAHLLLPSEIGDRAAGRVSALGRLHHRFERFLDSWRAFHLGMLKAFIGRRLLIVALAAAFLSAGIGAASLMGREFFPDVDAGLMRLHIRAPSGTRLEETARLFADIQREIRNIVPRDELQAVVENIGLPEPVNLAWVDSVTVGPGDGEMLIQLKPGHRPTYEYRVAIREMVKTVFPEVIAFFRPADIVGQTLNGSAAAALDVRFSGRDVPGNLQLAHLFMSEAQKVPGAVDVTMRQIRDWPEYFIEVDRARAAQLGVTLPDIANAVLIALSSSAVVQSNYWADGGISYIVAVQAPPDSVRSIQDVLNTSVRLGENGQPLQLRTIATVREGLSAANISRTTLAPTYNVLINVARRDLGSVYDDVERALGDLRKQLKPGNAITVAGQASAMQSAYRELALGMIASVILVYLIMVVNFQSWAMPLAAMSALPLAISGAVFGLLVTGTPVSVPALMGAIMVIGVSTANSVLVVSFARDRLQEGADGIAAAMDAVHGRFRPVLMTATAMIVGMIPMALGLAEGGEQNAPLGRAVIGGLLCGTTGSLFVVPTIFTLLFHRRRPAAVGIPTGAPAAHPVA